MRVSPEGMDILLLIRWIRPPVGRRSRSAQRPFETARRLDHPVGSVR